MIRYHNFPPEHPLPLTDAQARAMGCTIYRCYVIDNVKHEVVPTVTYWYNYRPCATGGANKQEIGDEIS